MLLAERLVGEARSRRARKMAPRERVVLAVSGGLFVLAAFAIALLVPNERYLEPLVIVGLAIGYVLAERVRFEFGGYRCRSCRSSSRWPTWWRFSPRCSRGPGTGDASWAGWPTAGSAFSP